MTAPNANSWLMQGGTPAAKFDSVGTTVSGSITEPPQIRQQTDFTTGKPLFWEDGNPRYQLVVNIDTGNIDPAVDNDDGIRSIYIRGNLQRAVREAVRLTGADGLEVGGHITVTYTGDGVATTRGMSPPKNYSAVYKAPAQNAAQQFITQTPQPTTPNAVQQAAEHVASTPAAQPPAGFDPRQLAALEALGLDPAKLGLQQ
jgi:hypothetical protein